MIDQIPLNNGLSQSIETASVPGCQAFLKIEGKAQFIMVTIAIYIIIDIATSLATLDVLTIVLMIIEVCLFGLTLYLHYRLFVQNDRGCVVFTTILMVLLGIDSLLNWINAIIIFADGDDVNVGSVVVTLLSSSVNFVAIGFYACIQGKYGQSPQLTPVNAIYGQTGYTEAYPRPAGPYVAPPAYGAPPSVQQPPPGVQQQQFAPQYPHPGLQQGQLSPQYSPPG
jgi:hypothetical protein